MPETVPVSQLLIKLAADVMQFPRLCLGQPDRDTIYHGDGYTKPTAWRPLTDLNDAMPLLWTAMKQLQQDGALTWGTVNISVYETNHARDIPSVCRAIVEVVARAQGFMKDGEEIRWDA